MLRNLHCTCNGKREVLKSAFYRSHGDGLCHRSRESLSDNDFIKDILAEDNGSNLDQVESQVKTKMKRVD